MREQQRKSCKKMKHCLMVCCMMLLFDVGLSAQNTASIQGKVLDAETQEPLIGVSIKELKANNATITNEAGAFSIKAKPDAVFVFTYVGYKSMELSADKCTGTVLMKGDSENLQEVVLVGFGVQKKVNVTGSVATASAKDLANRPVQNATQALQGIIPGLNIYNKGNGGELNAEKSIDVRGVGTIGKGSNSSPLVLIDGMEGDINTINPQDIENISVLKDAGSSAIYGTRAPFGVILISTKQGKEGKAVINYNNNFRYNTPILLPEMQTSWEYVNFYDDAMFNNNNQHYYTEEYKQKVKDYIDGKLEPNNVAEAQGNGKWNYDYTWGNVDWIKQYYKDWSQSQEHNISISGGTKKLNYYLSGSFLDQGGFMRYGTDNFNRYNWTAKVSAQATDYLNVTYSSRFSRTDYDRAAMMYDTFYENLLRRCRPVRPVNDPNGYYMSDINYISALKDGGRQTEQKDKLSQQLKLTFDIMKGWNVIAEMNMRSDLDWIHWDNKMVYSHMANDPSVTYAATMTGPSSNKVYEGGKKGTFLNPNIYTNYRLNLDKHALAFMLGFQSEQMRNREVNASRAGMYNTDFPVLSLTGDAKDYAINGTYNNWATTGFFGRMNYDYEGKYLLEGNIRYDGSSRFRQDKRWLTTSSFSAGWNIAREEFWGDMVDYVQTLKLRGSYGALGNQNTEDWYPTYERLVLNSANGTWLVNGAKPNTAAAPTSLVSSSLTWEKVKTVNFGLDLEAFKNRLTGSFDYFERKTEDMMGPGIELPSTLGIAVPPTNNCDLKTFGWELSLGWRDQIGGFKYGVKVNVSDSRSRVLRYANPTGALPSYSNGVPSTYVVGQLLNDIYGYTTIGIAKTDEEMQAHLATLTEGGQTGLGNMWTAGDIMYKDVNGDKKISNGSNTINDMGDMKKIGNSTPRYLTAINVDASWHGFDVSMLWQGVLKRDYWPGDDSMVFWGATGSGEWWSTAFKEHLDYFRLDENHPLGQNLDAYFPRATFNHKNHKTQTRYMQNAAYMRLKNLQFGYTLPKSLVKHMMMDNLRVFVSGENLLTITDLITTMDPETAGIGKRGGTVYPLSTTYSFGLSVNF